MRGLFLKFILFFIAVFSLCSCSDFLFYPLKKTVVTPDKFGVEYEETKIRASDGVHLNVWILKPDENPIGSLLQFHGNGENISTFFLTTAWLTKHGYEVILVEYRGYGKSEGEASFPDVFLDISAGLRFLKTRNTLDHFALGQSLGGSLLIYGLAGETENDEKLKGVILDAPFASYDEITIDILQKHWLTWLLAYPVAWLMPGSEYAPASNIKKLKYPILHFQSQDDQVVPQKHAKKFRALDLKNYRFVKTEGKHIQTFQFQTNRMKMLDFLEMNSTRNTL